MCRTTRVEEFIRVGRSRVYPLTSASYTVGSSRALAAVSDIRSQVTMIAALKDLILCERSSQDLEPLYGYNLLPSAPLLDRPTT